MKKRFVAFALALVVAGGVFAQSDGSGGGRGGSARSGDPKNWISGQVSLLGGGAQYERMLTPKFSVGGGAYFNSLFFFWNNLGIKAIGRFYPWMGLYVELGAGWGYRTGTEDYEYEQYGYKYTAAKTWYAVSGFLLEPGVGWKIDFGSPGGFFIEPMVSVPLVFGSRKFNYTGAEGEFKVGVGVKIAVGLGFAF
jgi:hypothetical protein